MNEWTLSGVLIFFAVNYFLTFLIIGLLAGVLSLINKPQPLRINVVAEALFSYFLPFSIGINNLANFVAHVFLGYFSGELRGWLQTRFKAEVGIASLGVELAG